MTHGPLLTPALDAAVFLVIVAIVLAIVRLVKGPSLADRVVALDLMTALIVSFCGLFALKSGETAYLDVAIVLALIGFLATVALARFIERRSRLQAPPSEPLASPSGSPS